MKKFSFITAFIAVVLLAVSSCIVEENYEFDPDFPYKDDPTTVGNFEHSKFEGVWKVKNLEVDWNNPPFYDYQPVFYVFRKNTMQDFGFDRDWNNPDELPETNVSSEAIEFLYSNTVIYTEVSMNYQVWVKTPYILNDENMSLGWHRLEKVNSTWNKDDLIGHWYKEDYLRYDDSNYRTIFSFDENTLVIQVFRNEVLQSEMYMDITLTDESFSGLLNFGRFRGTESTCFYYIVGDELFLSGGQTLKRFID